MLLCIIFNRIYMTTGLNYYDYFSYMENHTHLWTCSPKEKVSPNVVIALKVEASDTTNRKVF